ncbi:MAG TPA: phospholipase D family protein, partial [Gaiellaceae bacterium]|nr:phospholipase D family protein [Gaiellaceae bacterium]
MPEVEDGAPAAWFLGADERGNPATAIDRGRAGAAWTLGNRAHVHVDGVAYYGRLLHELCTTGPGDLVLFTDWEGDADERLDGPGTEVATVLGRLASSGVEVRGLLWRSHSALANFSEEANFDLARDINRAGGEILLDHRVRHGGSHHQKLVVIRHLAGRGDDVAFVGGIDLSHGRRDDRRHLGDEQVVELDPSNYGERPPWHDVQLEVQGPAVSDVEHTFRERWDDPAPLDTRNPWRALLQWVSGRPAVPSALPPAVEREGRGTHAVQVLRTYPARRKPYPFAPEGERSIGRAYVKAFERARSLVYLEDQYLWSLHAARCITAALRRAPDLRVAIVIPRYPDPDGIVAGPASRVGRSVVIDQLRRAGGDRVGVFDLENHAGTPIYVHSKVCVVDDLWAAIGSDNLNRRSWTHDSEVSCAVIDLERDVR